MGDPFNAIPRRMHARNPRNVAMEHSTKTRSASVAVKPRLGPATAPPPDDAQALAVLTRRLRVVGESQFAAALWPREPRLGELFVERMLRAGCVEVVDVLAHPLIPLKEPLARWQPGLSVPDLAGVSYRARTRWPSASIATRVLVATELAVSMVGGCPGHRPRLSEATHDLHVAAVYFSMTRELPTRAESWRGEGQAAADKLARARGRSGKLPDATVRDGTRRTAIEFVGDYSAAKLEAFHNFCNQARMGYELW